MEEEKKTPEQFSREVKEHRRDMQFMIDRMKSFHSSRELSLAITKLQESKMWLGQVLGTIEGNIDLNKERDERELNS